MDPEWLLVAAVQFYAVVFGVPGFAAGLLIRNKRALLFMVLLFAGALTILYAYFLPTGDFATIATAAAFLVTAVVTGVAAILGYIVRGAFGKKRDQSAK